MTNLALAAAIWIVGYVFLVIRTYEVGVYVYQNDRAWRVCFAAVTGGIVASALIAFRRERVLDRMSYEMTRLIGVTTLAVLVAALLLTYYVFGTEARSRGSLLEWAPNSKSSPNEGWEPGESE